MANWVADLYGIWAFSFLGSTANVSSTIFAILRQTVSGTSNGDGVAANTDASFACEYQARGPAVGFVLCFRFAGTPPVVEKVAVGRWLGDQMDGVWALATNPPDAPVPPQKTSSSRNALSA